MAHRNTYVLQGTMANTSHMIEGFIDGLMTKRPAFSTCIPLVSRNTVSVTTWVLTRPNWPLNRGLIRSSNTIPDDGITAEEAFDLSGNPDMDRSMAYLQLKYKENGREKSMEVAMTFADFAITEGRFRKHFRKVPRDAWNENMIELVDFLEMSEDERTGQIPIHLGSRPQSNN
jgi:pyruvate-ferredoxin/flavodoxin oxidoreductase